MAEYLVATWDGGGNVPPALLLGRELQRRGHVVRVIGHASQRDAVSAAGLGFVPYDGVRQLSAVEPVPMARLVSMFSDRSFGRAVLAELERRPVDVVVADCLLLPVLRACIDAGQRVVSLEHLLDGYLRGPWARGPVGLLARLRGLDPVTIWGEASLCLVAAPPSLDPGADRPLPATVRFVGPLVEPPARPGPATGASGPTTGASGSATGPAVLVSLSTFAYRGMLPALQRILDATATLDARVLVTTGPVVDPDDLRPAGNHELHRFVPHGELMPQVSMVVGHGGHATTMRALAHGLPLLVVPMHPLLDQPMVGRAVARAGAGEVVPKRSSPERLRRAVERLLQDGPHRAAAARLGAKIRALDGTRAAADLVCHLHP